MKKIKSLYDFVKHCEQVIENQNNNDELFIFAMLTQTQNNEEFLEDVFITLQYYYNFLNKAIKDEYYIMADKIWKAKNLELNHYIDLAKTTNKKIKKHIITIDKELKQYYLLND